MVSCNTWVLFKYVLLDTSSVFLNESHCTDCIIYILCVSSPSCEFDTNEFLQSVNTTFFSNIKIVLTDHKNSLVLFI